ncbi:MAG: hypothetical protein WBO45_00660, partial [Planctomycetota bacterium]
MRAPPSFFVFARTVTLLAALGLGCAAPLRAQDDEPPPDPALRVQKAIDDYQSLGTDRQKAAQRRKALVWLGEIDHQLATEFLAQELTAAGDSPFASTVIEAIGKVARPSLQPLLTQVLQRPAAPMAVR